MLLASSHREDNAFRAYQGLLTQLPALADLILDGNQFVMLPDTIGELTELRLLSCTNNHLAALPESLGKLKKLRRLLVQNNNLKSLPSSLWGCSNLADINASSNLLEDLPLPPVISEPAVAARAPESRPATGGSGTFAAAVTAVDTGRKGSAASLGLQMKAVQPLAQALKKLLLAIWDAMGSPLRCLDEFDVFMDNVNRAISTNMLVSSLVLGKPLREIDHVHRSPQLVAL